MSTNTAQKRVELLDVKRPQKADKAHCPSMKNIKDKRITFKSRDDMNSFFQAPYEIDIS